MARLFRVSDNRLGFIAKGDITNASPMTRTVEINGVFASFSVNFDIVEFEELLDKFSIVQ